MTGFIEDQILQFEGLNDADIAAINGILPDVQQLDTVLTMNWPLFSKVFTVLSPIVSKIVQKQEQLNE
jgi:hypothetical protein